MGGATRYPSFSLMGILRQPILRGLLKPFALSAARSAVYRRVAAKRRVLVNYTTSKSKPSGVARQLVTFSCFAKEKVTKKKATPVCRAFGVPCVARLVRRLRNSHYVLKQSSPTFPDPPPLLGGAQGRKAVCKEFRMG
jgi:hypothetical protein